MFSSALLQECIARARQNSQEHGLLRPQSLRRIRPERLFWFTSPRYLEVRSRLLLCGDLPFPSQAGLSHVEGSLRHPKGPEAYRPLKHLYPVYNHKLGDKWEDVGPKVCDLLDKEQVCFSIIDLVRFPTVPDQQTPAVISPVVIWVGVLPDSLAGEDAFNSANAILALLKDEGITAIDIEFRESVFRRSAGAELYEPASDLDATRHVIDPLTTAFGLPIAAAKMPHFQGTWAFTSRTVTTSTASRPATFSSRQMRTIPTTPTTPAGLVRKSSSWAPRRGTTTSSPSRSRSEPLALRWRFTRSPSGG